MTKKVTFVTGAKIEIEAVQWLWPEFVSFGALTILAGVPGSGKSTITMDLAAAVSNGGLLPTGEFAAKGLVIICNSEDHRARTMAPRLLAAGADMNSIFFPDQINDERFDIQDVPALERALSKSKSSGKPVRLLIIDPLTSVAAGASGRAVRTSMENLERIAEKYDVAILGVTHFSKGSTRKTPLERVIGSQAYTAVARTVLAAISAEETGNENLLIKLKSNIASTFGVLPYELQQVEVSKANVTVPASAVVWGELRDEEYIPEIDEKEGSALEAARDFLLRTLVDGPKPQRHLEDDIQFESFSMKTLRRAAKALGIKPFKEGVLWLWSLPD